MMKFAQFGARFIGKIHAANIANHPKAELVYIYDVNMSAAEQLAAKLGAKVAARQMCVEHYQNAISQGIVAAQNMLGKHQS